MQIVVSVVALLGDGRAPAAPRRALIRRRRAPCGGPVRSSGSSTSLPILPFDGGNIVLAGLEVFFPKKSRIVMLYASLVITIGGGLWLLNQPGWGRVAIYAAIFPLMAQLQMLRAHREPPNGIVAAAARRGRGVARGRRVARSPTTGPLTMVPRLPALPSRRPDSGASRAARRLCRHRARRGGCRPKGPTSARSSHWWVCSPGRCRRGIRTPSTSLADVLLRLGSYDEAAHYAADSFRRSASPISALAVARAAAALGDRDTAVGWLRAAEGLSSPAWINQALHDAPELARLAGGSAAAGDVGSR